MKPVIIVESQVLIEPLPTPPLPAETGSLPGTHQMAPNLLFYPVSDKRKAFTRIAYCKVVHPTAKDRIDLLDHSLHRLADTSSEDYVVFVLMSTVSGAGVWTSAR